jgi:flagellar biosynthesis/type III secretory pathway protein FliH
VQQGLHTGAQPGTQQGLHFGAQLGKQQGLHLGAQLGKQRGKQLLLQKLKDIFNLHIITVYPADKNSVEDCGYVR